MEKPDNTTDLPPSAIITTEATIQVETDASSAIKKVGIEVEIEIVEAEARTFAGFWLKVLNDWVMNFASGLAYHLLTAMFPVVIVLLIIVGFISGNSDDQRALLGQLDRLFPNILGHQDVLAPALQLIRSDAGLLGLLALVVAIFNSTRLFVVIEDYFDVIYHTIGRPFWRQNLIAFVMLLIFIVLTPFMLFASSTGLRGLVSALVASWLLFEAIYLIIPNQNISLRNSWIGALIAAILLQVYVALFPFYVRHFLGSYTGNAGFAIILLLFFYYFAVILLLGAEINAYFIEDIRGTPTNIAGLVHRATLEADRQKLAELEHKKRKPLPETPA